MIEWAIQHAPEIVATLRRDPYLAEITVNRLITGEVVNYRYLVSKRPKFGDPNKVTRIATGEADTLKQAKETAELHLDTLSARVA